MAPGRESNDAMKEAKALEKSVTMIQSRNQASPWSSFRSNRFTWLRHDGFRCQVSKNLGDLGNVAIIVPDNGLRAELVMMIDDLSLSLRPVHHQGAGARHRDCHWRVWGFNSEFSVLLNVKPENWTKEHHALFDGLTVICSWPAVEQSKPIFLC